MNAILETLKTRAGLRLMTHVVAGYPDLKTSEDLILTMSEAGADFIEIQIPFSDPMADGPTIMHANQISLDRGTRVEDCFTLAEKLRGRITAPLLFMSYINVPFRMGFDDFIKRSAGAGISGLILPDLPYDESMDENPSSPKSFNHYTELCDAANVCPIYVVSPDISLPRLQRISSLGRGFIYTTLKVGITGGQTATGEKGLAFLDVLGRETKLPIAAGFGISTPEQAKALDGRADIAVVGSQLIRIFEKEGRKGVADFIREIKK